MKNIFCRLIDLNSEADVEALFVERLLSKLNYPDNSVKRKHELEKIKVARGRKKELFRPDYVLLDQRKKPVIVIDAKSPSEIPEDYFYQVGGYAYGLNQRYDGENPVRYVVVANGSNLVLWSWDNSIPKLRMSFKDFEEDNPKFLQLRSLLTYGAIDVIRVTKDVFEFERPDLDELIQVFNECHNIIWKKEAYGPTDAFYEFAKLIFVKLHEDNRIVKMIIQKKIPTVDDFNFSVKWIQEQVERGLGDNPLNEILFKKVRDNLEEQITRGNKKRIFDSNEELNLRTETVLQVVEKLENYNLYGIDEDLNGRMFETFLNATVRGKELGQFFTPRSVVKYMCHSANLRVQGSKIPVVLDGCCGSGGFLIEAMAMLAHSIDGLSNLSSKEKYKLKNKLYKEHLYGVDKAGKIARIARLNMYLHGDGGSTIFTADMLDKYLQTPIGLPQEIKSEVSELKACLNSQNLRFDVVLTNPPFSMSYKKKNEDERRVLQQYQIALGSAQEKSNVLFLERYCDCLKDGGEVLTVIDNTVLNGVKSQAYRDYILSNFIIRQVVSLPFNTFFRAQANVQTSIVHLKKKEEDDEQGAVFMAILNNIGHDDHQRFTPDRDNIPKLINAYMDWCNRGQLDEIFEPNAEPNENLGCPFQVFSVPADKINPKRLDAFYYAPDLKKVFATTYEQSEKNLNVFRGSNFTVVPVMTKEEAGECKGKIFRYFEIGDVTKEGFITEYQEDYFENLPTRGRLRVQTNDVLLAKNNSSRGTSVIIPPQFDGQIVTTGFLAIRPQDEEEALLLWSIFSSEMFRKQVYYLAVTAVQPEIREDIFKDSFILPIPISRKNRKKIIAKAHRVRELQQDVSEALEQAKKVTQTLLGIQE